MAMSNGLCVKGGGRGVPKLAVMHHFMMFRSTCVCRGNCVGCEWTYHAAIRQHDVIAMSTTISILLHGNITC